MSINPLADPQGFYNNIKPDKNLIQDTLGLSSPSSYSSFYSPGINPNDTYVKELVLGHTSAAKNKTSFPGNRTFVDIKSSSSSPAGTTPKQCYDDSGNPHNLSVLVDTVNKTTMQSDPKNQGLLYSLFDSVQDLQKGISNIGSKSNPYYCKPITAIINDVDQSKSDIKYVLNSDISESFIDSAAYNTVDKDTILRINMASSSSPGVGPSPSAKPILSPGGEPLKDAAGNVMYQNAGVSGGGPTQFNLDLIKDKLDFAAQNFAPSVSADLIKSISDLTSQKNAIVNKSPSVNGFTTLSFEKYKKNPLEDPIVLFYFVSLTLLLMYMLYRLYRRL